MTDSYKPIACALYDIFEIAAMRKQRLVLSIDGREQDILVHDVYAKGAEEFLDGIDPTSKAPLHIRLDRIEKVFDPLTNKSYILSQC
jgi:transcriptional antiterminator Rof (Rho-off)